MDNTILVIHSTRNGSRTEADGTQIVDSQIEALTAALKAIRDRADAVLVRRTAGDRTQITGLEM